MVGGGQGGNGVKGIQEPGFGEGGIRVGAGPVQTSQEAIGGKELGCGGITIALQEEAGKDRVGGPSGDGLVGKEQGQSGRDDGGGFSQEEVG